MKRQQSFQGPLPKRLCQAQQFTTEAQGNRPQASQWPFNNTHPQSYISQQPSQQQWYYNNSNNIVNNMISLPTNNEFCGFGSPAQFTMAQLAPTHPSPTQLGRAQVPPPQFTAFNTNPEMTLRGDCINGNILPHPATHGSSYPFQMNVTTQSQQNVNGSSQVPQSPILLDLCQTSWELQPTPPVVDTISVPFATNAAPGQHVGWNVPRRAPFPMRETYVPPPRVPGTRKKRPALKDKVGLDMVKMAQSKSTKSPKPHVETMNPPTPIPEIEKPSSPSPRNQKQPSVVIPVVCSEELIPTSSSPQLRHPVGPREEPQDKDIQPQTGVGYPVPEENLDYGLDTLREYLALEAKREAEEAQQKQQTEEEAERLTQGTEWAGDPSQYPAECYENLRLPGCEFCAQAICVGFPGREWFRKYHGENRVCGRLVVYAVRRPNSDGVEFKLVRPGSSVRQVMQGPEILFGDIQLNANFADMKEKQVTRWVRYLLAAVPGVNDETTMWARAGKL